jgi:hypothetical protein
VKGSVVSILADAKKYYKSTGNISSTAQQKLPTTMTDKKAQI